MNELQICILGKKIGEYFPEVKPEIVRDESIRYNYSMLADVLESGNILWSESVLSLPFLCVAGMFAHEYSHLVNQIEMKNFSEEEKRIHRRRYCYNPIYKAQIEKAADRTAVERGFANEMITLIDFFRKDAPEEMRKFHLSVEEIKKIAAGLRHN